MYIYTHKTHTHIYIYMYIYIYTHTHTHAHTHTIGTFTWADGSSYDGEWADDVMDGTGLPTPKLIYK